ncbi:uncharacterized protein J7T54_000470 [Emericellopsis cladophorae]|uniref:Uncharacterized protein n=1 Tax=Emericellopsis cladophorae TaxID=2686198 RepID=A0A9Q0BB19_9HYPO|nr:uncharacterized protein J7T54_000470 [Emericellopsis cladophorae]KAI6779372.1 hypothetical protein J7T54_000470 [Emericellopsis cladophorae]
MICTIVIFIFAFCISIALAFIADADATVTPLTLGLLYSWMPVMVVFSIVDRNPHSTERSRELFQRWMYNVSYVFHSNAAQNVAGQNQGAPRNWWTHNTGDDEIFEITEFLGQGRTGEICGLALAVLKAARNKKYNKPYDTRTAEEVYGFLYGKDKRSISFSWLVTACISFLIFWFFILMAFTVAYNSPTAGLGCWSGSFLLYAFLSSTTWFVQFGRVFWSLVSGKSKLGSPQKTWMKKFFKVFYFCSSLAAILFLLFVTIIVLSGVLHERHPDAGINLAFLQ